MRGEKRSNHNHGEKKRANKIKRVMGKAKQTNKRSERKSENQAKAD